MEAGGILNESATAAAVRYRVDDLTIVGENVCNETNIAMQINICIAANRAAKDVFG